MATNPRIMPLPPVFVTSGKVWPGVHTGGGSGQKYFVGAQVMASLDGDATIALVFPMPTGAVPAGTLKLILTAVTADNGSHAAKFNPSWVAVSLDSDWSSASLTAEGTQTISFSSDADKPQELAITLDATTAPTAGQWLVMNLKAETSNWTVNQDLTFQAWLEYR